MIGWIMYKLGTPSICVMRLALLLWSGVCAISLAGAEPLSIEHILGREDTGLFLFDEARSVVLYEISSVSEDVEEAQDGDMPRRYGARRSQIRVFDIQSRKQADFELTSADNASYLIGGGPQPISPSGRFQVLIKVLEGVHYPIVFDWDTKRSVVARLPVAADSLDNNPYWLSESEIIYVVPDASQPANSDARSTAQEIARRRESGWSSSAVSSVSISSGECSQEQVHVGPQRRLISLDVTSGELRELYSGDIASFQLSSDRRHLALYEREVVKSNGAICFREQENLLLRVQSVDGRYSREFQLPKAEMNSVLSWSPVGSQLLFMDANESGAPSLSLLETETDSVTELDSGDLAFWAGSYEDRGRSLAEIPLAGWFKDRVIYRGVSSNGRDDWFIIPCVRCSPSNLTSTLKDVPRVPLARSQTGLFFLTEGAVFHVDESGSTSHIIGSDKQPVRACDFQDRNSGLLSRVLANSLPSIDQVPLCDDSNQRVYILSQNGSAKTELEYSVDSGTIVAAGSLGLVSRKDEAGVGSRLMITLGKADQTIEIERFNSQLAHVPPPRDPIRIDHSGLNGEELISWLFLPSADLSSDKRKHPLIVIPYGERTYSEIPPTTRSARNIWSAKILTPTAMPLYTGRGYAVLLPSIPLSPPPANPLLEMTTPVLTAVDAAIETNLVDGERMALAGASFGGYSALSIASTTDRFRAVVASASFSNLTSVYAEFPFYYRLRPETKLHFGVTSSEQGQLRMGAPPWADAMRYIENSPLFRADRIVSPLLLIHGDLDYVPIAQAEQMYTALARQSKQVTFIRYLGEGHGIRQPQNQYDMWRRVFEFLKDSGVSRD